MNLPPTPRKLPIFVQQITATVVQEREDEPTEWLYVSLKRDDWGQNVMHLNTGSWTIEEPADLAVVLLQMQDTLGGLMKTPEVRS